MESNKDFLWGKRLDDNFVRPPHSTAGHRGRAVTQLLFAAARTRLRRIGQAGRDCIDSDAVRCKLDGHGTR